MSASSSLVMSTIVSDRQAYFDSMLHEWHPAIVQAAGCNVLARGCHVSPPDVRNKNVRTAWVGYLLLDQEDKMDLRRAYWVVPVKMAFHSMPKKHNDVLRDIQQLDDALEHRAEYHAYASLLACPAGRSLGGSTAGVSDTHIVYVSYPCPSTDRAVHDQAAGPVTPLSLDAMEYSLALIQRFATCRRQDDPNSPASKDAQLMVSLEKKEPCAAESHPLTGCPISVDILACAGSALEEGTMWYLKDGIWVNDYLDRDSLGAPGQKITEAESELFALTALHATETISVYPLPSTVRWAAYIRRSLSPLEINLAIKALDAILRDIDGTEDARTCPTVARPRGKRRKIKGKAQPLVQKAISKLDILGQARHEDVSQSDSEAERSGET